jgi:hypothetical protein
MDTAGELVRHVHFDDRNLHGREAIADRIRGIAEASRVADDRIEPLRRHVARPLDELGLAIRVENIDFDLPLRRILANHSVQFGGGRRAVNFRLPRPEQMHVGALDHQDFRHTASTGRVTASLRLRTFRDPAATPLAWPRRMSYCPYKA